MAHEWQYSSTTSTIYQWQNPPDADIILRAAGEELHAHKLILSLASPVFKDMISIPQPADENSQKLPTVDVDDPPEALEILLLIIYPFPNPSIVDVGTLASVLKLADKYDVKAALDYLPSMYTDFSPIQRYAILRTSGHEDEAKDAARRVPFAALASLPRPLLQLMTVEHYQELMEFMVARNNRMGKIVEEHREKILNDAKYTRGYVSEGCDDDTHKLYSSTIVAALQSAFEENPCVRVTEALGIVSGAPVTFPPCEKDCRFGVGRLRGYAEGLLKDLVEMGESLPWGRDAGATTSHSCSHMTNTVSRPTPTIGGLYVNETGIDPKDIGLVMQQVACSRAKAVRALRKCDGDLLNAIMAASE